MKGRWTVWQALQSASDEQNKEIILPENLNHEERWNVMKETVAVLTAAIAIIGAIAEAAKAFE